MHVAAFAFLSLLLLALPGRADTLDVFCKTARLPSSIAICSDTELRALDIERQQAYDQAKARLDHDGQVALLAGQNGWVKSYPLACGLKARVPPTLPLAPEIRECMVQAGRARIAYLRAYAGARLIFGTPSPVARGSGPPNAPQTVPQFAQFAAPIYNGPVGFVDLSPPNAYSYRTRLLDGAQQPVNFAGHYQLVQWGCGTTCSTGAVIDALTGQVIFLPRIATLGMEATGDAYHNPIEFLVVSRLIVFTGQINGTGVLGAHFEV